MKAKLIKAAVGLAAFLLLGAALGVAWLHHQTVTPVEVGATEGVEVMVPAGVTLREMGRRLEKAGLIRSAVAWRFGVLLNPPAPIKAGRHLVNRAMDVATMAEALSQKPLSDDAPLTMLEGWRIRDADAFLAASHLIEPGAYQRAAESPAHFKVDFPTHPLTLEGYLYPETYRVALGPLDAEKLDRLLSRQLDAFAERFSRPFATEIARSGRTLHQLVTVASLLEREEANPANRPNIAGVIYKRLDAGTPLGIDATSRYALPQWNDRTGFLALLRDPQEPYNTRLKPGLPPTPIGSPSVASLLAALRPHMGVYWYYLHDAQGACHFARTGQEHEANRRKYNVY